MGDQGPKAIDGAGPDRGEVAVGVADYLQRIGRAAEVLHPRWLQLSADAAAAAQISRNHRHAEELSLAFDLHLQLLAGGAFDGIHQGLHRGAAAAEGFAIEADQGVAGLQARLCRGLLGLHAGYQHTACGTEAGGNAHHQALTDQHHPGQDHVGDHASGNHQRPLRQGTVLEQIGIARIDAVIGLVFGEGHKAAQGDQPQGIKHAIALLLQ